MILKARSSFSLTSSVSIGKFFLFFFFLLCFYHKIESLKFSWFYPVNDLFRAKRSCLCNCSRACRRTWRSRVRPQPTLSTPTVLVQPPPCSPGPPHCSPPWQRCLVWLFLNYLTAASRDLNKTCIFVGF